MEPRRRPPHPGGSISGGLGHAVERRVHFDRVEALRVVGQLVEAARPARRIEHAVPRAAAGRVVPAGGPDHGCDTDGTSDDSARANSTDSQSRCLLTVHEIYLSVQGESTHVGRPCVFVRLAACDLRCRWCDTPYAFTGGRKMSDRRRARGGRAAWDAAGRDHGRRAAPAGGRLSADGAPARARVRGPARDRRPHADRRCAGEVVAIVDVKCPGSGEADKMHWPNLDQLSPHDEVKFVIQDRADFDYACDVVRRHGLVERERAVLFSPVHGVLDPTHARPVDPRRAACRCACSSRRTSTSGARRRGASDGTDRAVVLLSGGLDSTTAAALARREGYAAVRADGPLWPGAASRRLTPRAASPRRSASAGTSSSTSISAPSAARR